MITTLNKKEMVNECIRVLLHAIDDVNINNVVKKNNGFKQLQTISLENYTEVLQLIFSDDKEKEEEILNDLQEVHENTEDENITYPQLLSDVFQALHDIVKHINPLDYDMDYTSYDVSLYNYSPQKFRVFATCEQYALDTVVDFLEEQGSTGYFLEEDEIENEDTIVRAGNHSIPLDAEHISIKEKKSNE